MSFVVLGDCAEVESIWNNSADCYIHKFMFRAWQVFRAPGDGVNAIDDEKRLLQLLELLVVMIPSFRQKANGAR